MRNETRVIIEENGQRHEFAIRQMSATQLEWWILRAIPCIGPALELPDGAGVEAIGAALEKHGVAALMKIDPEKAKPLLDEMLTCASRVVDGNLYPVSINTVDAFFSGVGSLFKLRVECFKANFGFFVNAARSGSPESANAPKVSPTVRMSLR